MLCIYVLFPMMSCIHMLKFFFVFFQHSTFFGSAWLFVFFIPITTANDLRLRRISIPDLIHYIIFLSQFLSCNKYHVLFSNICAVRIIMLVICFLTFTSVSVANTIRAGHIFIMACSSVSCIPSSSLLHVRVRHGIRFTMYGLIQTTYQITSLVNGIVFFLLLLKLLTIQILITMRPEYSLQSFVIIQSLSYL